MKASVDRDRRSSPEYLELLGIVNSQEPTGAIVLGSLGMGKTSLVESVLANTDSPTPRMRLYCTASLAEVPYGVLSPYLGSLQRIKGPVEVIREVNKTLMAEATATRPPIVVVEDAQHLDRESGFVLSLLVENAALKLIAIGAGVLDGDSPIAKLTNSDALSTIVVQPLDLNGVRSVAEEMVEGRISEGTARIIHATSGGNPSFVRAYVSSSMEQGILHQDPDLVHEGGKNSAVWVLARPLPAMDDRLKDLVQEMRSLTPVQEQETLELLALAGALPGKMLSKCGFPYRRLLEAGELRHSRDSVVGIAAVLHEAVLRQTVSLERKAELYAQWDHERRILGLDQTPLQLLWSIDVGVQPKDEHILRAVEQATNAFDFDLALKLCTSTEIASRSQQGALREARVLTGLERYSSARGLLVRLIEQTSDRVYLVKALHELLVVLSNLTLDSHDREMVARLCFSHAGRIENGEDPNDLASGFRTAVQLLEFWNALNTPGEARPAPSALEGLLGNESTSAEGRIVILAMLSDLYSIEGRCETALDLAREAWDSLGKDLRLAGAYQLKIGVRVGWNLLFAGRYSEASTFIDSIYGTSIQRIVYSQGAISLLEGLAELLQGRSKSSIGKLSEAITELRLRDPAQLLSLAIHLQQWALGRIGANAAVHPASEPDGSMHAHGPAAIGVAEESSARRLFARAGAAAVGHGTESIADFPLMEREVLLAQSAQLDDKELARHPIQQRLELLVRLQEGPRPRLIARLVELREAGDLDALEEFGREAVEHGAYQIGVEALTRVALRYFSVGEQRGCGAILRQVNRIIDEQNLTAGKFVARALALTELTAREKEIVDLARAGKNNAHIARVLTVSQRTVEGHLYRVFGKLGISERSELNNLD